MGLAVGGVCESPITGADGNREFLILMSIPHHDVKEE
jgi:predicted rRNA methylase YqxC with S4 and FtsJ domains